MAGAADDDLYNKKIKTAIAAEKKKKRLAAEAARKTRAKAEVPAPEPAQLPAVIADPFDSLHPSIDPHGPIPPVEPMPDVRAPPLPASFLQDQRDQKDAMDIIVLLARHALIPA